MWPSGVLSGGDPPPRWCRGAIPPPSLRRTGHVRGYIYISLDGPSMFLVALTTAVLMMMMCIYISHPGATMRSRANWPVCPPRPTAALFVTSPAPTPPMVTVLYLPPQRPHWRGRPALQCPHPPQAIERTGKSLGPLCPPLRRRAPSGGSPARGASIVPSTRPPSPRGPGPRAPPLSLNCPPPRPRPPQPANSPVAPTGAPRPSSQGREAPPALLAPGLGGGGPPVADGRVGTGAPGRPTARVTLPGPPP